MIFGYFGMMGGACALGSLGGAIVAHREALLPQKKKLTFLEFS